MDLFSLCYSFVNRYRKIDISLEDELIKLKLAFQNSPIDELYGVMDVNDSSISQMILDELKRRLEKAKYYYNSIADVVTISYSSPIENFSFPYSLSWKLASNDSLDELELHMKLDKINPDGSLQLSVIDRNTDEDARTVMIKMDQEYLSLLELLRFFIQKTNQLRSRRRRYTASKEKEIR